MDNIQNEPELYEESLRDIKSKLTDKLYLLKKRNLSKEVKTVILRNVDNDTFEMLKKCLQQLRTVPRYSDYKKLFNVFCKAMRIPSEYCTLVSEEFKKGKGENDNMICVKYTNKTKKIVIPAGHTLYHQTTEDISRSKELKPVFRGKSAKGYLYSSPRIYFSLKKLPKVAADISIKESTTIWIPKEDIQVAYVDPLLPNAVLGAIYVETRFPIAVKKYGVDEISISESSEEDVSSSEELEQFMKEYGLTFADEESYEESVQSALGSLARKYDAHQTIKNSWKLMETSFAGGDKTITLNESQYKELKKVWEVAKKTASYMIYKRAFGKICKAFGLPPGDTVINNCEFKKSYDGKYSGWIRYNSGKKKITVPNGTILLHCSTVSGITELRPSFRSRTEGRFLYASPRIYFSLGKPINAEKGGFKGETVLHKYTPSRPIQTAYIDPAAKEFENGAVFIESYSPIQVTTLEKFSQKFFDKLLDKQDKILNKISNKAKKNK